MSGSLHCLNCTPDEEHYSLITRRRDTTEYEAIKIEPQTFELDKEEAIGFTQVLIENTTLQVLKLEHSIKSMDVADVVATG